MASRAKAGLTAAEARRLIRELAEDTGTIVWTKHIEDRMAERGIDSDAVLGILKNGDVEEEPSPDNEDPRDWHVKIVRKMRTGRTAGVALVIENARRLILKTTQWEDGR